MTNEMTVPMAVQLDTKSIDDGIAVLQELSNLASEIEASLTAAFTAIAGCIQDVVANTKSLITAVGDAASVVETLTGVLNEQAKVDLSFNIISTALSSISTACDLFGENAVRGTLGGLLDFFGDIPGTITENVGNVAEAFVGAVSFTGDDMVVGIHNTVGAISDYIEVAKQATTDGNMFQTLFPKFNMTMIDTADAVKGFAGTVKEQMPAIGSTILTGFKSIPNAIVGSVKTIPSALGNIFSSIGSLFGGMNIGVTLAIVAIVAAIILLIQHFDEIKAALLPIWEEHLKPLWDQISVFISSVGENLKIIWDSFLKPLIDWILSILEPVVMTVIDVVMGALDAAINFFSDIISSIMKILDGVIQFIAGVFSGDWEKAWGGIVQVFQGIFEYIVTIIKGVVNRSIWMLNLLIGAIYAVVAGIVNGIGGIVKAAGNLVGQEWGFSMPAHPPQIPYLAQGAVLPANKPFLAMVGDQKHGTNVEAPLATIQEALANVLAQQGVGGDIHITFTGDLAQLGRVLKPVIERENRRVGTSLVKGVM